MSFSHFRKLLVGSFSRFSYLRHVFWSTIFFVALAISFFSERLISSFVAARDKIARFGFEGRNSLLKRITNIWPWYLISNLESANSVVPTPLEGGATIYSNGFLLFRQFSPIDIFIVES